MTERIASETVGRGSGEDEMTDYDSSVLNAEPGVPAAPSVARFAKGPWRIAYHDGNGQAVVMDDHIEICTCWHHSVGAIEIEMEANARLITAAPDLADVAREIVEFAERSGIWTPLSRAALAALVKASPQPERVSPCDTSNTDAAQVTPLGTPIEGGGR